MRRFFPTALIASALSLSLPLLLPSTAWTKTCTEAQIKIYLKDRADALFECDSNAISQLIKALKSNNVDVRSNAVDALVAHIGIQDKIVVPALVTVLKNQTEDTVTRQSVAYGLSTAAVEADVAVPILLETLQEKDAAVRGAAAYALRRSGTKAKVVIPALVKALEDRNASARSNAAIALAEIEADTGMAIPALVKALKDENAAVRSYAAYALSKYDDTYRVAIPGLVAALSDKYAHVRANAAYGIRAIGVEDKTAIAPLIKLLKDKNTSVRSSAAYALGLFSTEPNAVLPVLIDTLKDSNFEVRKSASRSLITIAAEQSANATTMPQTDEALKVVTSIKQALATPALKNDAYIEEYRESVERSLESLQHKRQLFLLKSVGQWVAAGKEVWLAHAAFWLALILVYPKSPQVQAIFFWNPWMRKLMGLGYVGFALTWVPFLRRKLFEPFRASLLADAGLENFKPSAYFKQSTVKSQSSGEVQPIQQAILDFKGQLVLEGASGLGKTMFLRHLCQQSKRVVAYLPATKCADGVIEAIQKKLHGEEIKDARFLQNLIYSGALAICIDGLNEVSAETRAKIVEFTENYFKGDIILATQPMEWTPPATAKRYVMQPLQTAQIQEFLVSRQSLIPSEAPVKGAAYEQACDRYLTQAMNSPQSPEELEATQRILSNPMDLTVVASVIVNDKQPDLVRLQEQQYQVMAEDYQTKHLDREFPLDEFSETVYQLRCSDAAALPEDPFLDEILCMARHKMVVSRQSIQPDGKPTKEWYFRHDKIAEFFILQTFLAHPERQEQHLGDPQFRGVYFMLASFLTLNDAIALREMLIQYAADTKDHTVSDSFIKLLRTRSAVAA
ncbi:HEAT repeat-containing protein [Leptolyngbyaceae cyanobacterium JSC-12]|nr:HEAT repeat-containing protein [Leptolyngbyaceae cyanobacterium JSC-12]